jgi:FMN phosphatase YigB (HAD superfamily)
MSRPAIVVFDLGKVLVDFDFSIAARQIAIHSRKSPDEVQALIERSRFIVDYESGRLTRKEFYECVQEATGFAGSLVEFGALFADIFTAMPEMIELHAGLRRRGTPTWIFSNTNDLAIEHIRRNFPFFANFDGYIYSYEVGVMKPQDGIYEALEKRTGRRGGEILYLDDRPENAAAGTARGWRAILHETPERSRAAVEKSIGSI